MASALGGVRRLLIERNGAMCHYCQRSFVDDDLTVDHRTPRSRGGSNDVTNLVLACRQCNHWKGCLTEDEFREAMPDHAKRRTLLALFQAQLEHRAATARPHQSPRKKKLGWCGRCKQGWHGGCIAPCSCPEGDCWQGIPAMIRF